MASLSLPRVLQLKKNSVDAEREQFEKSQTLAIQKAINSVETPVKEKHVRSTIIGTFQEQSAVTYWMVALRLPLQENRIVAWKFCHVTHKILREGHPACLDDSQRHLRMIENLGKLWVHLREGYGKLVHLYCGLLVSKLKFHARNPHFPGHMQLSADELDAVAENDVNNYFQLCVELFDYMDEILNLQAAVFDSLGNARANSMTASGQCRLAALIPCAQDASQIYDCNVRALFRLHAALPPDILAGHRDRFRQQFKKLGSFYKHASSLQYYRNLLTLPVLPSNPPNFLLQSDFGTYVTPVVSIPDHPPDEVDSVAALIDTSDTMSQSTTPDFLEAPDTRTTPSPQPDPIVERDRLIDHLQTELKRMRSEVSQMVQDRNSMVESMKEYSARLEKQLLEARRELGEEKQKSQVLLVEAPEIKQKLSQTEEKAKVVDEKFQKLKGAYTQLREEHISLIRQKAEVDKLATNLRSAAALHESTKNALQQQLNDKLKDVELLQQSASTSEEVEAYKSEITNLRTEIEQARQKDVELETLKASIETLQIDHKTASVEQDEKITTLKNDLKEAMENLEKANKEKDERDSELVRVKEELVGLREKNGAEYKVLLEEKEAAEKQVQELTQHYLKEKEEQDQFVAKLELDIRSMKIAQNDLVIRHTEESKLINDKIAHKTSQFNETISIKDSEIQEAISNVETLQTTLDEIKAEYSRNITAKDEEINELQSKIIDLSVTTDSTSIKVQELEIDNEATKLKLQECQSELNLKVNEISNLIAAANKTTSYITSLDLERDQQRKDIERLEKALTKTDTELQIEKTEFIKFRKQHDDTIVKYEEHLKSKCKELNDSHDEIQKVVQELNLIKEENQSLISKIKSLESDYTKEVADKNEIITQKVLDISNLKSELNVLQNQMSAEMDKLNSEIRQKDYEKQQLQTRLEHEESQRLSAECELQDLLQHNTILDADVAALKRKLEDAQKQLQIQTSKIVSCASEAALSVTNGAISALDRASALDTNKAAAELAARALAELANYTTVRGSEEAISRAAIHTAHNTAQLAAYVTDVSHVCTDTELADRLTSQSRSMLVSTKRCLECISAGTLSSEVCAETRELVQAAIAEMVAADHVNGAGRSVDDEMADMDRAIEDAAAQIDSLLAASKASDSGIKLEVNGKILDACTTLMAAVKILVQDARRLQRELGDVRARQRMYRRNPQWSEGLISAAKAVVLAAKMLVSAADEAASGGGRAEGVAAAAHEVAAAGAALVAASRARAPPAAPALQQLAASSRHVAAATAALLAAARAAATIAHEQEALDTSALTLTATRRLEMESKIRALELESALDAERAKLAALRKRHYHLAHQEENGNLTNGK